MVRLNLMLLRSCGKINWIFIPDRLQNFCCYIKVMPNFNLLHVTSLSLYTWTQLCQYLSSILTLKYRQCWRHEIDSNAHRCAMGLKNVQATAVGFSSAPSVHNTRNVSRSQTAASVFSPSPIICVVVKKIILLHRCYWYTFMVIAHQRKALISLR